MTLGGRGGLGGGICGRGGPGRQRRIGAGRQGGGGELDDGRDLGLAAATGSDSEAEEDSS
jgi:hypothetical protein